MSIAFRALVILHLCAPNWSDNKKHNFGCICRAPAITRCSEGRGCGNNGPGTPSLCIVFAVPTRIERDNRGFYVSDWNLVFLQRRQHRQSDSRIQPDFSQHSWSWVCLSTSAESKVRKPAGHPTSVCKSGMVACSP